MASTPAFNRVKSDVAALVSRIPAGWVATQGDIGRHFSLFPRHVVTVLAALDETESKTVPWWRVVADGGAVGRHPRRDEQMFRLREDGVPLSGVGIVQELAERRVTNLDAPPAAPFARFATPSGAPSRSRGMKSHPQKL
jgi:alkylated DNA nucleotide flippase Atl1